MRQTFELLQVHTMSELENTTRLAPSILFLGTSMSVRLLYFVNRKTKQPGVPFERWTHFRGIAMAWILGIEGIGFPVGL